MSNPQYGRLAQEFSHLNLPLQVLQSAAGFYIGTWDDMGPVSRESGYYPTQEAAQKALVSGDWVQHFYP